MMDLRAYLDSADRGAAAAIARAIEVSAVMVSQWADGSKPVPKDRCPAIEFATGHRVRCETMRPDITWVRIPHPDWPLGKPLLDLVPTEREPAKEGA